MNQGISITIGGSLSRGFIAAFANADRVVSNLARKVGFLDRSFKSFDKTTIKVGGSLKGFSGAVSNLSKNNTTLAKSTDKVASAGNANAKSFKSQESLAARHAATTMKLRDANLALANSYARVGSSAKNASRNMRPSGAGIGRGGAGGHGAGDAIGDAALIAGGYEAVKHSTINPVKSFASYEEAELGMRVSLGMMGGADTDDKIRRTRQLMTDLSHKLPGNKKDFAEMFAVIGQFGHSAEEILGGMGESTAKLSFLLHESPAKTAEIISELKTAANVKTSDMGRLSNILYKAQYSGGSAEGLGMSFVKEAGNVAGAYEGTGLSGMDILQDIAPALVFLKRMGLNEYTAGTNYGKLIAGASGEGRRMQKANDILGREGIELNFRDEKTGKFLGSDNLIKELFKLKKVDPSVANRALEALGGEGMEGQMAKLFATQTGHDGYELTKKVMGNVPEPDKALELVGSGLNFKAKTFESTMMDVKTAVGRALSPVVYPLLNQLGTLSAGLDQFVVDHQGFSSVIATGISIWGGSILLKGAMGLIRTKIGAGIVQAIVPGFVRGLAKAGLMGRLLSVLRIGGAGFGAAGAALFPTFGKFFGGMIGKLGGALGGGRMTNFLVPIMRKLIWPLGGLFAKVGPLIMRGLGPVGLIIGTAIAGWKIGQALEEHFHIGDKIADWIWGDTIKKAQEIPEIIKQSSANAKLRLKGGEANGERDVAINKAYGELSRLKAEYEHNKWYYQPGANITEQSRMEVMVAEGEIANLGRQKAKIAAESGDATGMQLMQFWKSRAALQNKNLWVGNMGRDSLRSDIDLHKLVGSGSLNAETIRGILKNNEMTAIPEESRMDKDAVKRLQAVLPEAEAKESNYNIQEIHIHNPVGTFQELDKSVQGAVKKVINDQQAGNWQRDRGTYADNNTPPN